MVSILFICLGNICRSPMAEYVMKDLVKKAGRAGEFEISSAATSWEEAGNDIYPPAKRTLAQHGVPYGSHSAHKMSPADYDRYDYIIGMDTSNLRNMERICGGDPDKKLSLLLSWAGRSDSVADPWYTGNFEATWNDVLEGCTALLNQL